MKIYFERSGGLAGMRIVATLDTDSLPSDEAHQIQAMVTGAKFFDLPSKLPQPKKGADYFQYKITVEKEGRKHTVETSDATMQPALRPLVDFLVKKARKGK
ncbi:MAG: protealysin inhibitor emfourin [Nitrososphaerales archaeon]